MQKDMEQDIDKEMDREMNNYTEKRKKWSMKEEED